MGGLEGRAMRHLAVAVLMLAAPVAQAGEADVIGVVAKCASDGTCAFDVTIRSVETGWDAYADRFEIVAPDGAVLGTRLLLHPHVDEQPFTRSLTGVAIPEGVAEIMVRVHHSVAGYDGATFAVAVPR